MNFHKHAIRTLLGSSLIALSLSLTPSLIGSAQAEKMLTIAPMGEAASLDPHYISGTWENDVIGDLFMGLTTEGADGATIPGVAESWTISEDGKIYTFTLGNHKWSDGTPVTAHDFEYAMQRIMDPKTAAEYASLLYIIKNGEDVNQGKKPVKELAVTAIDDKTLKVELNGPAPFYLNMLTHYTSYPVPKHIVEKHGKAWSKPENIVSNGAFKVKEWVPSTQIVLIKNDQFYDAANVEVDKIVFVPQEDRVAVQKRFRAGEIDIARDFDSSQISYLRKNLAKETRIAPYQGVYYYVPNHNLEKFKDARVRRALSMAINRKIIVEKVMRTGEVPAYSFVPPKLDNYPKSGYVSWKDLPMDQRLAEAKDLLRQAGYTKEKPLEFVLRYNTSENHKRIAIAVSAMWKKLDAVKVELFNTEVKTHYADLKVNKLEMARAAWVADYSDAQNFLFLMESRNPSLNYGRYASKRYDELMRRAETEADLGKRAEMMRQAEEIAMGDDAVLPIYHYVSLNLVSQRIKDGFLDNPQDIHRSRWIKLN